VSWLDRRDFIEHVAALALSATGVAGLDLDRLAALWPQADPTGTRRIGAADVEAIEQTTTVFVRQDFATGSAMVREAAVAHLHATLPLLRAEVSSELRPRLFLAIARLATQAGWMSFDVNQHDAARRLWLITLNVTRAAGHPLSADQTVFVLYNMAIQAVRLDRPDEALRLVHLGHAAATGPHSVSAATTSCLTHIQAEAHAVRGDSAALNRALGQAGEHFAAIEAATHAPWATCLGLDEARLAAYQGHAHYTFALTGRDPLAARRAVPLLRQAVDGLGSGYARSRAQYLVDLAGAHALAGDLDTAVSVGHQAIDAVTALHSLRAFDRLRELSIALEPLHTSPGIAELRHRLTSTAA
jgi:hypothetical protein